MPVRRTGAYRHKKQEFLQVGYVRSRQRKKDRVGPITDNQGRVLIKDEEVAEAISKYFGSVYEKEEGGDVPVAATMFKGGDEHKLRDVTFTKERVIKELEKLRTDKSPGLMQCTQR